MDTPDVCKRCAASPPTCCVLTEGEKELCFPLFPDEMKRLQDVEPARAGSPDCEAAFVVTPNTQALIQAMLKLFPEDQDAILALFPEDGQHYRLGTDGQGYCVFLGKDGCVLPAEQRPAHCRLFPMWVAHGKQRFLDAQCLAISEARGMAMLYRLLNTDPGKVRKAYDELRHYWGLPPVEEELPADHGGDQE